jgi:hypothetical protein
MRYCPGIIPEGIEENHALAEIWTEHLPNSSPGQPAQVNSVNEKEICMSLVLHEFLFSPSVVYICSSDMPNMSQECYLSGPCSVGEVFWLFRAITSIGGNYSRHLLTGVIHFSVSYVVSRLWECSERLSSVFVFIWHLCDSGKEGYLVDRLKMWQRVQMFRSDTNKLKLHL